jgi:hypothetical protein
VTAATARQQKSDARAPPPPLFLEDDEEEAPSTTAPALPPLQRSSAAPLVVPSSTSTPVDADPVLASLFRQAEASAPQFVVEGDEKAAAAVLRRQPGCQRGPDATDAAATEANDDDNNTMLARLSAWRALHGTSHVPRRVHDAADLGEWLWAQRRARRKKELPSWLEQALDALGADWRPTAEASRWHAAYHAARRALEVGVGLGGEGFEEEEEEEWAAGAAAAFPGGWRAARAFAAAGGATNNSSSNQDHRDPLHDLARSWLRQQGELLLASSPGLAPHHGAAATAAERRGMLRRLAALAAAAAADGGGSSLEVRARRSAVADAAAMAGLNAHERKLERRRRRDAEKARLERRERADADAKEAAEVAVARVRAEEARREALLLLLRQQTAPHWTSVVDE